MLNDRGRDFTQRNKTAQALIRFEQHKKPDFCHTTFGGTMGDQTFLRRGSVDLSVILGREDLLEARISCSLNGGHGCHTFIHGGLN
jgi:hypothetical protein